jgi:hypothetical protein
MLANTAGGHVEDSDAMWCLQVGESAALSNGATGLPPLR